ncbi:MAG: ATP-grasp domain-containing protein [Candidatus Omnitrophota bacterium]|nr:ATP-grasp domain-containing protein [Candidatus Omnitrophota bacterium]
MKKKLKVLLVFDAPYAVGRDKDFKQEFKDPDWVTESDVYKALEGNGYQLGLLGLYNNIGVLFEELKRNKPDVVFNLAEVFRQKTYLEKNMAWLLEMLGVPYTGASPTTMLVCNNKALSKKILSFHRIKIPNFHTFYRDYKIKLLRRLRLPLIVKPLCEEASRGISRASVVDDEAALVERVKFIHQRMNMDAIAEEYIEGREFYVSIIGRKKIKVLPLREMNFGRIPEQESRLATYRAKWDKAYRKKWGIENVFAGRLAEGINERIEDICKRAFRALNMQSYARFDVRVTSNAGIYILEANANPCLARDDELGQSAQKAGISYDKLIQKILLLALQRKH